MADQPKARRFIKPPKGKGKPQVVTVTWTPGQEGEAFTVQWHSKDGRLLKQRDGLPGQTVADLERLEGWEEMQWHRGVDFHEVAEALGVPTDCIMAARNPESGSVVVFWTPEGSDPKEPTIMAATLKRGQDGVLFLASQPEERVGMWEEIRASIEGKMREQFGEPDA